MPIEMVHEPLTFLSSYAAIPASFLVERIADVVPRDDETTSLGLRERDVVTPYVKDYDALDDGGPLCWPRRFDVSRWALLAAYDEGRHVGAAAVAFDTVDLTDGRGELAVLWDIRVMPAERWRGVGSSLLRAAGACAAARNCRQFMAETQNVNVPACRFYARHGCVLRAARRFAYPGLPDEVQLLWYRDL